MFKWSNMFTSKAVGHTINKEPKLNSVFHCIVPAQPDSFMLAFGDRYFETVPFKCSWLS